MTTNVIGITGYKGAGKDTVADIILEYRDYQRFAFAEKLKVVCSYVFNIDREYFDIQSLKTSPIEINFSDAMESRFRKSCRKDLGVDQNNCSTMYDLIKKMLPHDTDTREIMTIVGGDIFRGMYDDNVWLNFLPTENVVVTDVRYPNEYDKVKSYDGVIIKVVNETQTDNDNSHSSESHVEDMMPNYTILNNGTDIQSLIINVLKVLKEIDK